MYLFLRALCVLYHELSVQRLEVSKPLSPYVLQSVWEEACVLNVVSRTS